MKRGIFYGSRSKTSRKENFESQPVHREGEVTRPTGLIVLLLTSKCLNQFAIFFLFNPIYILCIYSMRFINVSNNQKLISHYGATL